MIATDRGVWDDYELITQQGVSQQGSPFLYRYQYKWYLEPAFSSIICIMYIETNGLAALRTCGGRVLFLSANMWPLHRSRGSRRMIRRSRLRTRVADH